MLHSRNAPHAAGILYDALYNFIGVGTLRPWLCVSGRLWVRHAQQEKHLSFILNAEHRTHVKDLASLHQIVQVRTRASDMHFHT